MSWHDAYDARQKLLEPLVQRAIDRVRRDTATRLPTVTSSLFYGAIGIDPTSLVIWYLFADAADQALAEAKKFTAELDRRSRAALRDEGYPEDAIAALYVSFGSDQEIQSAGGWDFFR